MFTYDTDRNVASFQLAQYVLNIDSANLNDTLDSFVPSFHRQYLTINANPGRWCTGLGPIKPLQTLTWKYAVENTSLAGTVPFGMDSVQQLLNRQHLDNFAVILLKTTVEALSRYEYVIGFELIGDGKFGVYRLFILAWYPWMRLMATTFFVASRPLMCLSQKNYLCRTAGPGNRTAVRVIFRNRFLFSLTSF